MKLKAKKLLLAALMLSAAAVLNGCGHGPWFHGHGHGRGYGHYNGYQDSPRYQRGPGHYRGPYDNQDYWR